MIHLDILLSNSCLNHQKLMLSATMYNNLLYESMSFKIYQQQQPLFGRKNPDRVKFTSLGEIPPIGDTSCV